MALYTIIGSGRLVLTLHNVSGKRIALRDRCLPVNSVKKNDSVDGNKCTMNHYWRNKFCDQGSRGLAGLVGVELKIQEASL
jgi:hypothetical protein